MKVILMSPDVERRGRVAAEMAKAGIDVKEVSTSIHGNMHYHLWPGEIGMVAVEVEEMDRTVDKGLLFALNLVGNYDFDPNRVVMISDKIGVDAIADENKVRFLKKSSPSLAEGLIAIFHKVAMSGSSASTSESVPATA